MNQPENIYTQKELQNLDSLINLNYDKLVNYIRRFLSRTDATTIINIPNWISQAELRLAKDLKNLGGMKVVDFSVDPSTSTNIPLGIRIEKPAKWRETKSMSVIDAQGGRRYIYPRTYEYVRSYIEEFADPLFIPTRNVLELRYYSDYDFRNYLIGPYLRIKQYKVELSYFEEVLPLSSTNSENWWTLYAPRALIYATLVEASYFLRSDDRSTNSWEPIYQAEIQSIMGEDQGRYLDSSNIRKV